MTDLVLMVPFGLYPGHTPWGAEVLSDYLNYKIPEVDVCIWDLRYEDRIQKLLEEHSDCISRTLNILFKARYRKKQPIREYGPDLKANYIAVILRHGSDIFSILQSEKIPVDAKIREMFEKKLQELKKHFESVIQDKVRDHFRGKNRIVFGISIYERTLFESLNLASVVRRAQDGVSVIAGGEAMNISTARAIVERNNDIDGAVVGFGELILSKIMHAFLNGTEIRDMQFELDGLINAKTISKYLSLENSEQIAAQQASLIAQQVSNFGHNVPASVRFVKGEEGRRYSGKSGTIDVLARRGCDWGLCVFCAHNVKKTFIDPDLAATKREIKKILDELPAKKDANEPVHIKFSSDNNDIEFMINLLNWLSSQAQKRKIKFKVWFWMTVRQFSRDVAYELKNLIQDKDVELDISMAIESLNQVSLKNMGKGISPLQGLKALKTLHDIGGKNFCWYFTYFPLDTVDSVAKEYYFMKNSLHLISDPKTHLFYTPYQVSLRDAIYRNPKKYGIVLNSFNDLWMDKAFNLQLPMSSWDVEYSIAAGSKLEEKIVGSWYRIERKWEKNTTLKNLGKDKIALNRFSLFHLFVMHLNLLLEIVRHVTVQAFARDFSYLKRAWILINLKWWTRISLDDTDSSNGRFPQFFLKNSRLIKKYPWPFRKKWSIRLNPMELEILRYLYEPRKFDSIFTEFRTKYTRKAIQMILERHICLGSILQHKNMLMSIFHDPDYLQTITD